jgi:hypothetical protein
VYFTLPARRVKLVVEEIDMSPNHTTEGIRDNTTYTHNELAQHIDRSPDWVIREIILPGDLGRRGVRCRKVGTVYFIAGDDFRFWVQREAHSQP